MTVLPPPTRQGSPCRFRLNTPWYSTPVSRESKSRRRFLCRSRRGRRGALAQDASGRPRLPQRGSPDAPILPILPARWHGFPRQKRGDPVGPVAPVAPVGRARSPVRGLRLCAARLRQGAGHGRTHGRRPFTAGPALEARVSPYPSRKKLSAEKDESFRCLWSGRLDLNQRPLRPEGGRAVFVTYGQILGYVRKTLRRAELVMIPGCTG